ncbi:MAG TPA: RraA family protein [Caldilineaceae bacterium]|nr:RraA family protein [Caldilineaceae bacterium]
MTTPAHQSPFTGDGRLPAAGNGLFELIRRELRVAVICDVLDDLGFRHQAMHQRLRPLLPDMRACGFAGQARTLRWMETDYIVEEDPYGLELDFMDSLQPGDVVVHSTDAGGTNAPWGELMTTIALRNGAVGCVCDSQIRDAVQIIEMGFPVYYTGIRPLDSKGRARVMAYDVPVRCGDVLVHPHDLVVADYDGIVVIPQAVVQEVVMQARDKMGKESLARRDLLAGKSLREVYNTYGVL